jgi:hypothetical protein
MLEKRALLEGAWAIEAQELKTGVYREEYAMVS